MSAWYAGSRGFDIHIQQHSFMKIGQEIISTAIPSHPLIQEGQLSGTGERMCTNYSFKTVRLAQEQCGPDRLTDYAWNDLKSVEGL